MLTNRRKRLYWPTPERLLRYYQSFGMVSQLGNHAFAANNVTKALASLGGRAGRPFK
jgi:hypothetical protein